MRKGEQTKQTILGHAVDLARSLGLEGLSIGRLAEDLKLSKSGLFAHFQSKERLQMQVLEAAGEKFSRQVVRAAVSAPRGPERMWAIFENWMKWGVTSSERGGCIFVAASVELDDQPGPVRDTLVALLKTWVDVMETTIILGQKDGHFRNDIDVHEVVQRFYGIMLSAHLYHRLFRDETTLTNARAAVKKLIEDITAEPKTKRPSKGK